MVGSRRITAYGMAYIYELFPFSGVSQIMLQYVFRALRRDDETVVSWQFDWAITVCGGEANAGVGASRWADR